MAQMSQLDSMFKEFCRDMSQLNADNEKLDASGMLCVLPTV